MIFTNISSPSQFEGMIGHSLRTNQNSCYANPLQVTSTLLKRFFSDSAIMSRLTETKFTKEVEILNRFMRLIDTNPDKAYYGYLHVNQANEEMAIEHLLVTDELFRSTDIATRKKYVSLVESVRERGGNVFIFSTLHVSGSQLQQVSGVAAILRFPLPDIAELEDEAEREDEDSEEEDDNHFPQTEYDRVGEDLQNMGF
uniref:eRF1 domain-containing protein n=1 Tax=Leptocylindrus danicus TaxID=163516 RepID=A0A7S2JW02_9STRA|mmetsp:Transcript_11831/g.17847  ORF Transcript_11831/g.17847 Transcript_11831/m.17847 type:complete len:199 (+) Transcript_11831:448-1044(+)